jgi:hypothetical protein
MDTPLLSLRGVERELAALQKRLDAAHREIDLIEAEMEAVDSHRREQWCWFPQPQPEPPAKWSYLVHGFGLGPILVDADH